MPLDLRLSWRVFSILEGIRPLNRKEIPTEIVAGITLAALAIPEVMGYTKIAGTPVATGLYTLVLPAIIFALFSSSRHLVVGADSATAAILASGLIGLAAAGSDQYLALAILLALIVGVILLFASFVGLGFMADFMSQTVLVGFLTGVGIQVALGSVAGLLGLEDSGHRTVLKAWADVRSIAHINFFSLALGASVIAIIAGSTRISSKIPAAMLAVAAAILLSWLFDFQSHMKVLGPVPSGLPIFQLPKIDLSLALFWQLTPTALAMVFVILTQSAATSRAYAEQNNERLNETVDMRALGLANLAAGLTGTFTVNGSPTKTEMVVSAGGRTQLSLLVASLCTILALLFLTQPLSFLPNAALSAVVFLIGLRLVDIRGLKNIYKERRKEFYLALLTALVVVVVGVEEGIVFAIILSLVLHTRVGYRPRNLILVKDAEIGWHVLPLNRAREVVPGLLLYRFTHSMYYANTEQMRQEIEHLANTLTPPLKWFCIDVSAVDFVDYTALETLRTLKARLKSQGIRLLIARGFSDADIDGNSDFSGVFDDRETYVRHKDVVRAFEAAHPVNDSSEPPPAKADAKQSTTSAYETRADQK